MKCPQHNQILLIHTHLRGADTSCVETITSTKKNTTGIYLQAPERKSPCQFSPISLESFSLLFDPGALKRLEYHYVRHIYYLSVHSVICTTQTENCITSLYSLKIKYLQQKNQDNVKHNLQVTSCLSGACYLLSKKWCIMLN